MKALVYHGPASRSWDEVPDPTIEAATDITDLPLLLDLVNVWTGTLILALGLDLSSLHAAPAGWAKKASRSDS